MDTALTKGLWPVKAQALACRHEDGYSGVNHPVGRESQVTWWLEECAPWVTVTARAWGQRGGTYHESAAERHLGLSLTESVELSKEESCFDRKPRKGAIFIGLLTGLVTACFVLLR
jgi:hypothetical protein